MRIAMVLMVVLAACGDDDSSAAIDAAPDTPTKTACERAGCTENQVCIQRWDGVCGGGDVGCVPKTVDCPDNACTQECQDAYCPAPYQCMNRVGCGTEEPGTFKCYGP